MSGTLKAHNIRCQVPLRLISALAEDPALLPDLIMDTVHKDKRADGIERTGLPLFNPIKVLKLIVDIPGAEASGIKGDYFILNAGDIPLVFGDELLLEFPVAVSGDVNLELSIMAFQGFGGMAVPFVGRNGIVFLILFITEGSIEFRFH